MSTAKGICVNKKKKKETDFGRWMECVLSLVFFLHIPFCREVFGFKTNTPTITSLNGEPIWPVGCIFFYHFQVEKKHSHDVTLWTKSEREKKHNQSVNRGRRQYFTTLEHFSSQTLKTSKITLFFSPSLRLRVKTSRCWKLSWSSLMNH